MTGEYCKDALGRVGLWRVRDLDSRSSLGAAAHSVSYLPDEFVRGGTACWRSTGRLWTLAEHPGDRALYGVPDRRCR